MNGEFLCSNNSLHLSFNEAHKLSTPPVLLSIFRFPIHQSRSQTDLPEAVRARSAETRRLDHRY